MYVPLHLHSPYSHLDGASTIRKLVERARELGLEALALTDHDSVSGAVEFHKRAREAGLKPIQGAEVTMEDGGHLVLLAQGPEGYAHLCRLLTRAHLENERGRPRLKYRYLRGAEGLICLTGCRRGPITREIIRGQFSRAREWAVRLLRIFGPENLYLELEGNRLPGGARLNRYLMELAEELSLEVVAASNVHYARKEDFWIHDLLTCVRTLTRLEDVHPERRLNAENYLKSPREMSEIFPRRALENTLRVADRCRPALVLGERMYPDFPLPPGTTADAYLRQLVYRGAEERYGEVTAEIARRLDHELDIIRRLGYAGYFLLVWDVCNYARRRGIRYAGRGSAADSAVAYCLHITEVDAVGRGLLFERFMSLERAERPDIDVDFDARYRDDVANYVYEKYGRERVAAVCTYNTFRVRSALRDLGKAMGFSSAELDFLAKRVPYYCSRDIEAAVREVPELRDSGAPFGRYRRLFEAVKAVVGLPRHLGTHLGGLVICREPLTNVTPLQRSAKGVVICQFDKEYVEDLGMVKLDLLSLKTLSVVEDAAKATRLDYETIPLDDEDTYRMINRGETVGVFQLESPAQRALQARLGARTLEDIVASVALIRPGPIKGNMVEPFIARRKGEEPITYLHPKLKPILEKTYGVVLFQEQVIEIATAIAGFSPGEADRLRRVMTHARSHADMAEIGEVFVAKARRRGVSREVAETIFSYITGYASYGFCEAHAAAFGTTAYKTAYLVKHCPAEFYAAMLSHQPMGYYPPNTICNEARRRGIAILPPDVNESGEDFLVQRGAIRVSLKQVKGMRGDTLRKIMEERERAPFGSLGDFCRRVRPNREVAENLVLCGAFDSLHPNRREALWRLGDVSFGPEGGLFVMEEAEEWYTALEDFSEWEKALLEYEILGLNVKRHFMSYLRPYLAEEGFMDSLGIKGLPAGRPVRIAGMVIRPHRPPTRSGKVIVFLSLEDEYGLVDITVFNDVYEKYGVVIFQDPVPPLEVRGRLERRGNSLSVIAEHISPLRLRRSKGRSLFP